jgi:hypothetical protein
MLPEDLDKADISGTASKTKWRFWGLSFRKSADGSIEFEASAGRFFNSNRSFVILLVCSTIMVVGLFIVKLLVSPDDPLVGISQPSWSPKDPPSDEMPLPEKIVFSEKRELDKTNLIFFIASDLGLNKLTCTNEQMNPITVSSTSTTNALLFSESSKFSDIGDTAINTCGSRGTGCEKVQVLSISNYEFEYCLSVKIGAAGIPKTFIGTSLQEQNK